MIDRIAADVSNKLNTSVPSRDFDNFVEMSAHMENMELLLPRGSNEVRMVGIWGPSGIGKTTIARVLFTLHSRHFQHSVFMENIKSCYQGLCSDEYGAKKKLQEQFLSEILNQEDLRIRHLGVAEDRLKDKRVLAVLDDVDDSAQLDAIAKETWWFGPGSWIIVTTQDKNILTRHGINCIYKVDFPPDDEALQIFCMNAFGQKSPYDGFENLARQVTELSGNLPLGLSVMGSHFRGMSKQDWEEELPRLRDRLDVGKIESILKFSYDALRDEDQALFLHIACFFNGKRIKRMEAYLSESFVGVNRGLRVLRDKSLIDVQYEKYIKMHYLLVRLGREIVRKQSPNEPGHRQFLVDAGDICQVLCDDTLGGQSVIGINLNNLDTAKVLKMSDKAFERMSGVKFLSLNYYLDHRSPYVLESLSCLPPNLRLLRWTYFRMTCLPSNINTEFLVEIIMRNSNLEKLWEGDNTIRNLKWMDLSNSSNLKELPDLSTAANLLELELAGCSSLLEIPSSIGKAINLQKLDLTGCSSLVELSSFSVKLKKLRLNGCTSLMKLPSSLENAGHLLNLPSSTGNLKDCSSLVELPSSARISISLEYINFAGCSSLVELPSYVGNATHWEFVLDNCSSLRKLPSSIGNMTNLKKLSIKGGSSLVELPSSIGNMTSLQCLCLRGCSSLVELPCSIGYLHNLSKLNLKGCSKLRDVPINMNMKSLDFINLTDCSSLKSFPKISTTIAVLRLKGTAIEEIPPSINRSSLSRLFWLDMSYSENLEKSKHAFDCITELDLSNDTGVQEIAPWVKDMSRLRNLVIKGCKKLVSLPQLPDSLRILKVNNCESLERLDCSFDKTDMYELSFVNCFKLNQVARDLIIQTSTESFAVFPGDKVPTYFTFRATGSSLSVKLSGFDTNFPTPLRFKTCVLLVDNGEIAARDCMLEDIYYRIKDKPDGETPWLVHKLCPPLEEHLFVFEFEKTVNSAEFVFELGNRNKKWEIEECGVRLL